MQEIITIAVAITFSVIIILVVIYYQKRIDKEKKQTEKEVRKELSTIDIRGNKLKYDGRTLEIVRYDRWLEYDLVTKSIVGKEDIFLTWKAETIEKLKREIVQELPFQVIDKRIEDTNLRRITITTYAGVER